MATLRSCASLIGLGLLVALLAVGWLARDEIVSFVSRISNDDETAVEAPTGEADDALLARQVEAKVIALGQGDLGEVALDADQVSAWIGSMHGFLPAYVSDVSAALEEERLVLSGRVAIDDVPGSERLGPVTTLLGDTVPVTFRGLLDGLQPGWGVMYVEVLQIGVIPVPDAVRDDVLSQMKGDGASGLPTNAVPFQLPSFVTDVGVRGDSVILKSSRGGS